MRTIPKLPCWLLTTMIVILGSCNYTGDPEAKYFDAIAKNDVPLADARPGDWRHEHNEKQQSFAAYRRAASGERTDSGQTLTLLPIGAFTPLQLELLEDLREYCAIFFQREVRLMPAIPDSTIPSAARRFRDDGHEQLQASYINDSLLANLRHNGEFGLMAISASDLYPQPEWNFVFGLANYSRRVAVSSIYRLQDDRLVPANYTTCLLRLIRIASHEVAHMLRLRHCLNAQCVMNGTNNLRETDSHPARACSVCQQKLHENLGFDIRRRLEALAGYFSSHGMQDEAALCRKDLGVVGGLLE